MVFIHVKTSALTPDHSDEFLVETKTSTKVDDMITSIVEIHNIRLRAALISSHLSTVSGNAVGESDTSLDDPSNEQLSMLQHAAKALVDCIDTKRVGEKVTSTYDEIDDMINAVRDAAKGLPNLETLRTALEEPMEKLNLQGYVADERNATLYAFNKEFLRGQLVSDRLGGTNEKTKVICKLTLKDAGPPPREAIVSEAERNAMAAFYFKRQEELKRLADADEDDYLNSEWADPKGMKRNLQGLKDVKAPGLPL